ncbi:YtxH domain-containing protein [Candidatus Dojkabacteria bacterium]|nr:YtxH domain-containing protein [Candidatus Dojkabacteria bacterium]
MKRQGPISGALFLFGAVVGALAGVTAGILLAPKSGKETREDIKRKTKELKTKFDTQVAPKFKKKITEIKTKFNKDIIPSVKKKVATVQKDVTEFFSEKKPKPAKK